MLIKKKFSKNNVCLTTNKYKMENSVADPAQKIQL